MRAIHTKLRSERGASITYALLLFLVCAVVASVVLAAGTAAAGRLSRQVESDQRYYSVSSAARMLQTEIESISITKTVTTPTGGSALPTTYKINDQDVPANLSGAAALLYEAAQKDFSSISSEGIALPSPSITAKLGEEAIESLAVEVKVTLMQNGSLVLDVYNAAENESEDRYTNRLTFTLDQQTSQTVNDAQHTTSEITKMTWKLYETETIMRAAA